VKSASVSPGRLDAVRPARPPVAGAAHNLTPDSKSADAKALMLKARSRALVTALTALEFVNAIDLRRLGYP
jgi:hypothetical protein